MSVVTRSHGVSCSTLRALAPGKSPSVPLLLLGFLVAVCLTLAGCGSAPLLFYYDPASESRPVLPSPLTWKPVHQGVRIHASPSANNPKRIAIVITNGSGKELVYGMSSSHLEEKIWGLWWRYRAPLSARKTADAVLLVAYMLLPGNTWRTTLPTFTAELLAGEYRACFSFLWDGASPQTGVCSDAVVIR